MRYFTYLLLNYLIKTFASVSNWFLAADVIIRERSLINLYISHLKYLSHAAKAFYDRKGNMNVSVMFNIARLNLEIVCYKLFRPIKIIYYYLNLSVI